jgi:polyisoprenoid-binding protein YceI
MMHPMHAISFAICSVSGRRWRILAPTVLMALGMWIISTGGGTLPGALAATTTEPPSPAATQPAPVQFISSSNPGTTTVSGTSTLHNWTATGTTINGTAVFAGSFNPTAHPAIQSIQLVIPVNSLKSSEGGGMDKTMYDALKMGKNPNITYSLGNATFTSGPTKDDPQCHYTSIGKLTIAGWAKWLTLPLDVSNGDGGTLNISTQTSFKLTDFGMTPPTAMLGMIKSGDDVTVKVTWQLTTKGP